MKARSASPPTARRNEPRAPRSFSPAIRNTICSCAKPSPPTPARPFRIAATAGRYKASGRPVVLIVSHSVGGGTDRHIESLTTRFDDRAHFLIMRPLSAGVAGETWDRRLVLTSARAEDAVNIRIDPEGDPEYVFMLLRSFGVSRVHIHHTLGLPMDLQSFIRGLDVPFDFTVHDYYGVCPQIHMLARDRRYCGEPDVDGCNVCIAGRSYHGARDVVWWRAVHTWLFREADRVICPSGDVAARIRRYHADTRCVVAPHDLLFDTPDTPLDVQPRPLTSHEPLRVALLGVMAPHKGSELVAACARRAKREDVPVEFHIVGCSETPMPLAPESPLHETGAYRPEDLPDILAQVDPHLVWFPSQCRKRSATH